MVLWGALYTAEDQTWLGNMHGTCLTVCPIYLTCHIQVMFVVPGMGPESHSEGCCTSEPTPSL